MSERAIDGGLVGLALGRLGLGAAALVSPARSARLFGFERAVGPELSYMARIFGIRAITLGCGYLGSDGDARRRWQRLAFMCDISDTVTGIGHLRRADLPGSTAVMLTGMTGAYAAIGTARIALDATRG